MTEPRRRFSIVSAVYDVEPYLGEYFDSLEAQDIGADAIEVIAVDDGSTDRSLAALEAWAARSPVRVVVVRQENRGQAAARNAGLRHATGDWVTFTDPDDKLDPRYLGTVSRFVERHPDLQLVGTLPVLFDETGRPVRPVHPRTAQFRAGNRVVDLEQEPNSFPGSATVSLFRLDRIRAQGLEFDEQLRPIFEDQHFTARYLLGLERPVTALVRSARYRYRKRTARDSTMQQSFVAPGRYTTVVERGYLDLLRRARRPDGSIPAWVQQLVIYDLSKLFREHDKASTRLAIPDELHARFHELLEETIAALDPDVVYAHTASRLTPVIADTLAHAFPTRRWRPSSVARTGVDPAMGLQRLVYRYAGAAPDERVIAAGTSLTPPWSKHRPVVYFGREMLGERIVWTPLDATVALDGAVVPIVPPWTQDRGSTAAPKRTGSRAARWRARHADARHVARLWIVRSLAAVSRSRYRDAWVVMDRINRGGGNGERLFEYLRRERRDINAWFVLRRGAPGWERLEATAGDRLVAHGTRQWRLLMSNARWLLATDPDRRVTRPRGMRELVPDPTWRFGFLQPGVAKDDVSAWFNKMPIDLLLTSTQRELDSIVADGTAYGLTGKEARLTGLPRFDRLARLAAARSEPPDTVVVAPTWRAWLMKPDAYGRVRRVLRDDLVETEFMQAWLAILADPSIVAAATDRGLRLVFLPHPALTPATRRIAEALPGGVTQLTYARDDVQASLAACALLVTDYSSVAFDAAFLERPVVYYQFDREAIRAGRHIGRPGWFDYERDGFGPVAVSHEDAVAAIVAAIQRGPVPEPVHAERMTRIYPVRDARASARVVEVIESMDRR